MSANPEDWTQWLALASAVHNNRRNVTTGLSPNQILIGYELQLTPDASEPSNNDLAEECVRKLMENQDQATRAINEAAKGNRTISSQYQVGDQVWLEGKNLKFPHQATKLNPKCYDPSGSSKRFPQWCINSSCHHHGTFTPCSMHLSYHPIAKHPRMAQTSPSHHLI